MLRKIKLYGELAKFIGHKEFEVKIESLSHAVSFLINNFEGVEKYMSPKHYQVKVGNYLLMNQNYVILLDRKIYILFQLLLVLVEVLEKYY